MYFYLFRILINNFTLYPIISQIFGFDINTYPIVIFFSSIICAFYFSKICLSKKLVLDFLSDYFILIVLVTFLFARLGGVFEAFSLYLSEPLRFFYIFDGRYNFFAGFIGFLFIFYLFSLIKKENFWNWMDALSQPFILFFIFNSVGEFFSGANYGTPSSFPWAVSFNIPEVRYTIPVHPVQLYEAGLLFLLMLSAHYIKTKSNHEGITAAYSFFGFFVIRSLLFFLRGAPDTTIYNIPFSLVASIFFSVIALIVLILKTHPNIHFVHHEH